MLFLAAFKEHLAFADRAIEGWAGGADFFVVLHFPPGNSFRVKTKKVLMGR
jgi:hypothetical protein